MHHYVAISEHVRARILRCYGREATVIYPPVDVPRFGLADGPEGDFYLVVSALVPYKRIDLAIGAIHAGAVSRGLANVDLGCFRGTNDDRLDPGRRSVSGERGSGVAVGRHRDPLDPEMLGHADRDG